MTQHVIDAGLRNKKAVLWTPWGSQRVPDLDKTLETPAKRTAKRRPAAPAGALQQTDKMKPGRG